MCERVACFIVFEVGVHVDESGCDDAVLCVEDARCVAWEVIADGLDLAVADGDVGSIPGVAGAIDDPTVDDE